MEKKTIGSFISALRRAAGMTQRDLAEQLNVSDKAVSRWERDESAPDLTLLPLIADLFGITVDELLRGQRRPVAEAAPQTESVDREETDGYSTPQMAAFAKQMHSRRQKMLFGNRLRKLKMLNYISLGLFAAGVIAALLCNFAFYRAALGFFLGLLFEVAAVICALAFANAAMPVSEEDYDTELLQGYKKDVIRVAYLPIYLAALTVPLLLALLGTWLEYGVFVGLAVGEGLLLLLLATLLYALLVRELALFVFLPRIDRCFGIPLTDREVQRRACVGRLAKRVAITTACAMILPVIAVSVLTCGMFDSDTDFVKGTTFEHFDDFAAHMADQSQNGTAKRWTIGYDINGDIYRALISEIYTDGDDYVCEVIVPSDQSATEILESEDAIDLDNSPHRAITGLDGKTLVEFDWLNTNVGAIRWSFDESSDGMPATVYTIDQLHQSRANYDMLVQLLGVWIVATPLCGVIVYALKRKRLLANS